MNKACTRGKCSGKDSDQGGVPCLWEVLQVSHLDLLHQCQGGAALDSTNVGCSAFFSLCKLLLLKRGETKHNARLSHSAAASPRIWSVCMMVCNFDRNADICKVTVTSMMLFK